MAYTSLDDMTSELAAGKSYHSDWFKLSGANAYVAGNAYDLSCYAGVPIINAWTGTALNAQVPTEATGWGIYHGGNVSTDVKQILSAMGLVVGTTAAPGMLILVDVAMYYPGISLLSTSAQTMVNGTSLSRYTNGKGLRPYIVMTALTGNPAGTPVMDVSAGFNYRDQDDNDAIFTGMALNFTTGGTAIPPVGKIVHCGPQANLPGPFLPLNAGDTGIKRVNSFKLSTAYTTATVATAAIVLAKPILTLPLVGIGVPSERAFFAPSPLGTVIPDGACLSWLYFPGAATAANSTFFGSLDAGWG
jgi:hypothetical protein